MSFRLTQLTVSGKGREDSVHFGDRVTLITGASNTGKSYILDCIRHALGKKSPLRAIQEASARDTVSLVIRGADGTLYSLQRALKGGHAHLFKGNIIADPTSVQDLGIKRIGNAKAAESLSYFLLTLCGLEGRRLLASREKKRALSFSDLRDLAIVDETRIIQTGSPLLSGSPIERTAEKAVFSLLLTGIDDSAIVTVTSRAERATRDGEREAFALAAKDLRADLDASVDARELVGLVERINAAITDTTRALTENRSRVRELQMKRRDIVQRAQKIEGRETALQQVLDRFQLLQTKYQSDLERLDALVEAHSEFGALPNQPCPICGTPFSERSAHHGPLIQGVDALIEAAQAEAEGIRNLMNDLGVTLASVTEEANHVAQAKKQVAKDQEATDEALSAALSPLTDDASALSELVERKSYLVKQQVLWGQLTKLSALMESRTEAPRVLDEGQFQRNDVSARTQFLNRVEGILSSWKYPGGGRAEFSEENLDLIISGKGRADQGKGLRALAYAAFSLGLMEHSLEHGTGHPGFVVLDSPLVTYRDKDVPEGEGVADEVKHAFFKALAGWTGEGQVIILENEEPDNSMNYSYTHFTGTYALDRPGFLSLPGTAIASLPGSYSSFSEDPRKRLTNLYTPTNASWISNDTDD